MSPSAITSSVRAMSHGEPPLETAQRELAEEGLFDPEHKVPIPTFPSTVAVVTSPTGAVIRDILRVLSRRYANLEVGYLLQRIESYRGLAILTTNLDKNLDQAADHVPRYSAALHVSDGGVQHRSRELKLLFLHAPEVL